MKIPATLAHFILVKHSLQWRLEKLSAFHWKVIPQSAGSCNVPVTGEPLILMATVAGIMHRTASTSQRRDVFWHVWRRFCAAAFSHFTFFSFFTKRLWRENQVDTEASRQKYYQEIKAPHVALLLWRCSACNLHPSLTCICIGDSGLDVMKMKMKP